MTKSHLVPKRSVSFTGVDNGTKFGVRAKVIHQILHSLDALNEIDNLLLVVLSIDHHESAPQSSK